MKNWIIKLLGGYTKQEYEDYNLKLQSKAQEVEANRQGLINEIKKVKIEVEGFYDLDTIKELNSRKEFIEKLTSLLT